MSAPPNQMAIYKEAKRRRLEDPGDILTGDRLEKRVAEIKALPPAEKKKYSRALKEFDGLTKTVEKLKTEVAVAKEEAMGFKEKGEVLKKRREDLEKELEAVKKEEQETLKRNTAKNQEVKNKEQALDMRQNERSGMGWHFE